MSREAEEIWPRMLKKASNVDPIARGTAVLLGTNGATQKSIIRRLKKSPSEPVSNDFCLGYSFIEYKDEEHDDKLSHLDLYTLDMHEDQYKPMIQPVLERAKDNLLVTIILDWDHVDKWGVQLRDWMKFIRYCVQSPDDKIDQLRQRLQAYVPPGAKNGTGGNGEDYDEVELPLEEGQYALPLGVDIVLCAIGSENVVHEGQVSDDTVDFAQQFIRSIAWKCGGSVVYIPYSLDIPFGGFDGIISERLSLPIRSESAEKAEPSVVEPDKLVIPAGWDSRAKICAVRDEGMSVIDEITRSWDLDNESAMERALELYGAHIGVEAEEDGALAKPEEHVPKTDFQEFLAKQHEILEKKLSEEPRDQQSDPNTASLNDFNVGGIQIEGVEEVLRRLKARDVANSHMANAPVTPDRRSDRSESNTPNSPGGSTQNEVLANFFQNLLDRRRNSPGGANSPG